MSSTHVSSNSPGCKYANLSLLSKASALANDVQKVQLQLKAGEKQDKSDDSPVTIADYGEEPLKVLCTTSTHEHSCFAKTPLQTRSACLAAWL